jgi:hypothetical protein
VGKGSGTRTPTKAISLFSGDRSLTGSIEFARALSTTVLVSSPHCGALNGACFVGALGAAWDFRTACRSTVSVIHSPPLKTLVWKAMVGSVREEVRGMGR